MTGSTIPTGVTTPVLPICHFTSCKIVVAVTCSRGFKATANLGYLEVYPNFSHSFALSILYTNPS